ncbi:MAG: tetratricopeptide repeat protein [Bacteroidetes bacterium]|nr:tetratricopeptide repeat protein [Bacteroidota bacterium]
MDSLNSIINNSSSSDTAVASAYLSLSEILYSSNPDTLIPLCKRILKIVDEKISGSNQKERHSFLVAKSSALNNIGYAYNFLGDISKALDYYRQSIKIDEELSDKQGMASTLNNIGGIYDNLGDITKALDYYHKSLKIKETIPDKLGMAYSFQNIGTIYIGQGDTANALEYFNKSLSLREEISDKRGMAQSLNNLGYTYYHSGNISKAMEYFQKSISIEEEIHNKRGIASSLNNIGGIYLNFGDPYCQPAGSKACTHQGIEKAFEYYKRSLQIRLEIADKKGIAQSLHNVGGVFFRQAALQEKFSLKKELYTSARHYADSSLLVSKELGYPEIILSSSRMLSSIDSALGNYKLAFEYYKLFIQMSDSIKNTETQKATVKKQMQYEFDKKEAATKAESDKHAAVAEAESKKQKIVIWSVIAVLLLMIVFAGFIFRALRITQKQKQLIEQQKKIVEEKQSEILASIRYAKRIQDAILPTEKYIHKTLERLRAKMPKDN